MKDWGAAAPNARAGDRRAPIHIRSRPDDGTAGPGAGKRAALDIRIVNLERSPDRREAVLRQIAALGLTASISTAVDGATADLDRYRRFVPAPNPFLERPLTRGEIGCFASHHRLWEECIATDRPLLILEDDCLLAADARVIIDRLPDIVRRFRFVRLAGSLPRASRRVQALPDGRAVGLLNKGPHGTVAYALTPEAAALLLVHADVWREPVDLYVDSFWIHGLLPYCIEPYPVSCPAGGSLIEASRFDRGRGLVKLSRQLGRIPRTVRRLAFQASPAWRAAA